MSRAAAAVAVGAVVTCRNPRPPTRAYSSEPDDTKVVVMLSGFQLAHRQAEAYETHTGVFMSGSAKLLATGSEIGSGDALLDLACGTGLVARHAAPLVQPGGRVVGADINPAMLAVAREHAPEFIEWIEATCEALPVDDASFTHVICQQGVQFFPEPVATLREAHRMLRPGGTIVATVWASPEQNPYIDHQLELLAALDAGLVDSVRRATPPLADRFLATTARSAGFSDVEITVLEHEVDVPELARWFLDQTGGTPWGPTIAALDDGERAALAAEMAGRLAPYEIATGHRIPFRSYRLRANRPQA